jgi:hypothetical protein
MYILVIIVSFFMQNSLLGSQNTHQFMVRLKKSHRTLPENVYAANSSIGEFDLYLFRHYLAVQFNKYGSKIAVFKVYDEILEGCSIINDKKVTKISPLCLMFSVDSQSKEWENYCNKPPFMSNNKQNKLVSTLYSSEVTAIDNCSYIVKSNGVPRAIVCCFFSPPVLLKWFMNYVKSV